MTTSDRLARYFENLRANQHVSPESPPHEALEALARGELDAQSAELLHDRLLTDPAARRRYRRVLAAQEAATELNSRRAATQGDIANAAMPSLAAARRRRRFVLWASVAAIAAVIVFLCRDLAGPRAAVSLRPKAFLAIANMPLKGNGEAGLGPALRIRIGDSIEIENDAYSGESKFVVLALDGGDPIELSRSTPTVLARELFGERPGRYVVLFAPAANATELAATRTRVEAVLAGLVAGASISEVHSALARQFGFGEGDVRVLVSVFEVLP